MAAIGIFSLKFIYWELQKNVFIIKKIEKIKMVVTRFTGSTVYFTVNQPYLIISFLLYNRKHLIQQAQGGG